MRQTHTTGPLYLTVRQEKLDAFWNLIEDKYEEDWHVEQNGDVTLEVDGEFLEEILHENYSVAYYAFGTWAGGRNAEGESFLLDMPLYLKGTYIIKGIYAPDLSYVKGDYQTRTYFFVQEGF
jgi:hypothetical protein